MFRNTEGRRARMVTEDVVAVPVAGAAVTVGGFFRPCTQQQTQHII